MQLATEAARAFSWRPSGLSRAQRCCEPGGACGERLMRSSKPYDWRLNRCSRSDPSGFASGFAGQDNTLLLIPGLGYSVFSAASHQRFPGQAPAIPLAILEFRTR